MRLSTLDRYLFSATIPKPNSTLSREHNNLLIRDRHRELDLVKKTRSQKIEEKKKKRKKSKFEPNLHP